MLMHAVATHNFGFAGVLLEHGAEVNARNGMGQTALHIAARQGQDYLVSLLIKYHADVNGLDGSHRSPKDYARAYHHSSTDALLRRNGAVEAAGQTLLHYSEHVADEKPTPRFNR